ncbi:hypothetical protein BC567DRAFT_18855 [Phyllosticta citribraziliensis]
MACQLRRFCRSLASISIRLREDVAIRATKPQRKKGESSQLPRKFLPQCIPPRPQNSFLRTSIETFCQVKRRGLRLVLL